MRRDEEEVGQISIISSINIIVGDFEITDVDIYAQLGNQRVTEIPIGEQFEIHADYFITNKKSGLAFTWSTSMTVWDLRGEKPIGSDNFGLHPGGGRKDAHDAINLIMEHEMALYRVKIWANQAQGAGAPPENSWR